MLKSAKFNSELWGPGYLPALLLTDLREDLVFPAYASVSLLAIYDIY